MNPILRNILVVIAGLLIGGSVNMGIIKLSGSIFPIPDGVDVNNIQSIIDNIGRYEPVHFLCPFLAHSLGTFVAAFIVSKFAANTNFRLAMFIGVFSLIGGIMAVKMIPAPMWYNVVDLSLAYIPMAWLAYKLANTNRA